MNEKPFILWAEDDPDDLELFLEPARAHYPSLHISHVLNGQELLDKLEVLDRLPALIILDLNMPVMDGKTTIFHLKNNLRFSSVPVIVLTTSQSVGEHELLDLYQIEMITKPSRLSEIEILVDKIALACFAGENLGKIA